MIDLPEQDKPNMSTRFRGYLPVVLDVETGGFNPGTDALLESAMAIIEMNERGFLELGETSSYNIKPFQGANIEDAALQFTGIDPDHPFRYAIDEKEALEKMFSKYLIKPAPRTGPRRVPAPPRMVIRTTSPEAVHCIRSAPASGSIAASRPPARPAYMPEMTKAASV